MSNAFLNYAVESATKIGVTGLTDIGALTTALVKNVEDKQTTHIADILKAKSIGGSGIGWGNLGGSFLAGGIMGSMATPKEDRGVASFIKGGLMGGLAGGVATYGVGKRFMSEAGLAGYKYAMKSQSSAGAKFAYGAMRMGHMVESAGARSYVFGTGAMLGGAMFGGISNKRRGMNANRGNRF